MVCRGWTRVKPRQIGSGSIFDVSACQRTSVISTIIAAGSTVALSSKIKLLGVTLDGNLNLNEQVENVCGASFFHFRALPHIRPSWTEAMANVVACALVQ